MDQNYLIDLVSGLFGSKKQVEIRTIRLRAHSRVPAGLTGVASYLKRQGQSGVARYLENLEELSAADEVAGSLANDEEALAAGVDQGLASQQETVTSVAKYLEKLDQFPVSSVTKYMARQAIFAKKAPKISGVAKYMAKHDVVAKKSPRSKQCCEIC